MEIIKVEEHYLKCSPFKSTVVSGMNYTLNKEMRLVVFASRVKDKDKNTLSSQPKICGLSSGKVGCAGDERL